MILEFNRTRKMRSLNDQRDDAGPSQKRLAPGNHTDTSADLTTGIRRPFVQLLAIITPMSSSQTHGQQCVTLH